MTMDVKKLVNIVNVLLTQPAKAWRAISHSKNRASMLNEFLYPLIMLCCLSTLLGTFLNYDLGADGFYFAAVKTGLSFLTLFFAYHLSAVLVAKLSSAYLKTEYDKLYTDLLTGYSMVVILLLDMSLALFPNFRIIGWILQFYTVKIVWDGAAVLLRVPEERRFAFTIMVSLSVIVIPILTGVVMSVLSANLG